VFQFGVRIEVFVGDVVSISGIKVVVKLVKRVLGMGVAGVAWSKRGLATFIIIIITRVWISNHSLGIGIALLVWVLVIFSHTVSSMIAIVSITLRTISIAIITVSEWAPASMS
jgi:hypothetical protein